MNNDDNGGGGGGGSGVAAHAGAEPHRRTERGARDAGRLARRRRARVCERGGGATQSERNLLSLLLVFRLLHRIHSNASINNVSAVDLQKALYAVLLPPSKGDFQARAARARARPTWLGSSARRLAGRRRRSHSAL